MPSKLCNLDQVLSKCSCDMWDSRNRNSTKNKFYLQSFMVFVLICVPGNLVTLVLYQKASGISTSVEYQVSKKINQLHNIITLFKPWHNWNTCITYSQRNATFCFCILHKKYLKKNFQCFPFHLFFLELKACTYFF